ncbi:MAG: hypothetical protein Q4G14_01705 [Paracoccus sp. (in: a-proteobacteria)]|uniref:hypothetical protein n=1 Tax=Paracoccus sp. TaxID=267 RepID=UPI0026E0E204|nr:hypothetical protein [Paracoccus sp. (in: a-proteobacteria)]MDO5611941.1 hypothetical protein [Paracoccus sp. (in: a-proteobacteria)]
MQVVRNSTVLGRVAKILLPELLLRKQEKGHWSGGSILVLNGSMFSRQDRCSLTLRKYSVWSEKKVRVALLCPLKTGSFEAGVFG